MSDPSAQGHTNESRRTISEVESLRAENTQIRTERDEWRARCLTSEASEEDAQQAAVKFKAERDRLRRAITEALYAIDNYDGEPMGAIASILDDAIYDAALIQREGGEA